MGLNAKQLRELVVKPALEAIGFYSMAAEDLIMGTAAQESRLKYIHQLGTGPALGLFQMEPTTYYDIWENYLAHRPGLALDVREAIGFSVEGVPEASRMVWDLRLAAIMCRIHYLRVPEVLPAAFDPWAQAHYWKKYYNTVLGAGEAQEFVDNYALVQ